MSALETVRINKPVKIDGVIIHHISGRGGRSLGSVMWRDDGIGWSAFGINWNGANGRPEKVCLDSGFHSAEAAAKFVHQRMVSSEAHGNTFNARKAA